MPKPRIAIFDLSITADSPAGSCILQLVTHLSDHYQFIIFADRFENPHPDLIHWVRVPLPKRPILLRYLVFYGLAPIFYRRFVKQAGYQPDLTIATEGQFPQADICYAHFCHRAYLRQEKLTKLTLRSVFRIINRRFNAYAEGQAFARATTIVAPSSGLAQEIAETYGVFLKEKLKTIPNPVDTDRFARPQGFNSYPLREQLGFSSDDLVLVFVALGDFERKGLPLLIQALASLKDKPIKLLVVGGVQSEINTYQEQAKRSGVLQQIAFVGFQPDVRPYLWAANIFVLPSAYETFSLVTFQAAAAGLPIMATRLYGVENFLSNQQNGWLIENSSSAILVALNKILANPEKNKAIGQKAQLDAVSYGLASFVENWDQILGTKLKDHHSSQEIYLQKS